MNFFRALFNVYPKPNLGEIYEYVDRNKSPFDTSVPHRVEVIAVRDGWVNYRWINKAMGQNQSLEYRTFDFCYKKLSDLEIVPMSKVDLAHWAKRWSSYGPATYASTYPPEIWVDRYIEIKSGIWPFIKKRTVKQGGICKLCEEELLTGHQCQEIYDYIVEGIERRKANEKPAEKKD